MKISTAFAAALGAAPAVAAERADVVATDMDIGFAVYEDSLIAAQALDAAIDAFLADPSDRTLAAARSAWLAARVPYQKSEVFRFGDALVDEWEGRVNAWPLDEGMIDYVAGGGEATEENPFAGLNVIATPVFTLGGAEVDATVFTAVLPAETRHEADGVEANVATGCHAIEFLLWGQDLNGFSPGAGDRPYTDYVQGDGRANGNCDRRAEYLAAASDLLVADLEEIVAAWDEGGAARAALEEMGVDAAIVAMFTGMGSLSYG